jgi:hypothetical protein
LPCV